MFKKIFYIFTFSLIVIDVFAQTCDTSLYKKILLRHYIIDTNIISVEKDSFLFDGYIFFKYNRNDERKEINSNKYITFEILFSNSIDLKNLYYFTMADYYEYLLFISTYENLYSIEDSNNYNAYNFNKFKKLFYNYFDYVNNKNSVSKIFLQRSLCTNIFHSKNIKFVINNQNMNTGYYIFKCSFNAIILKYFGYINDKISDEKISKISIGEINVLLPISPLITFDTIRYFELYEAGYRKSNWRPEVFKR